ncbi:BON domain-containing protein [Paraburkholderia bengalensis]|uniref:BON domain-containing protein n=1 Tax=Paraburkholderia bengalensis TaxID=2747562 RepID=A0ABU8IKJ9_9BURK
MNAIKTLKLACTALILVVVSVNAWPQASDATAGASATQTPSKKTVRKANRALSRKVLTALSKGGVDTVGINVLAKGGAVTLTGSVTDPSEIDKAASIAKGVSGVTSVKNSLTVREGGQ